MTNLGAHVVLAQRNGYSEFCKERPRVVNSVDQGGALLEAKELSGEHAVTIFRTQRIFDDAPGDLLSTESDMADVARYWYQEHPWDNTFSPGLRGVWELNPADFYGITNEIGGDDVHSIQRVIDFEWEVTKLANADGFRTALFNASSGTPGDIGLFKSMYIPAIMRAWNNGGNIYARHAYQISEPNLVDEQGIPYPGNPERPFIEINLLRQEGWNGGMALTEVGLDGGFGYAGDDRFVEQLRLYEQYSRQFPNIIGVCMWTLGDWRGANWQSAIPEFIQYMSNDLTDPWIPPDPTIPPLPPIGSTLEEYLWDITVVEQIQQGLRFNPEAALQQELAISDLQIVINEIVGNWGGHDYIVQAGEDVLGIEERQVVVYQPGKEVWSFPNPHGTIDPLPGLEILAPFKVPFVLTSGFDDLRTYANGLHEGGDWDVIGLVANSKEPVLCGYPGIVTQSKSSSGSYGKFVVVRCEYLGTVFYLWYAHMDERYVTVGTNVTFGTALGEVGTSGLVTGEHVHINLQVPGKGLRDYAIPDVIDPVPYIRTTPQVDTGLDMADYFIPFNNAIYGDIVILKNNWGQGDERQQLQYDQGYSWVTKNDLWEQRAITTGYIDLVRDISPGDDRYYEVQGHWIPRKFHEGEYFNRSEFVEWFFLSNCSPDPSRPPGTTVSDIYFASHYPIYNVVDPNTGLEVQLFNVIELRWLFGSHVEETYFFAEGMGLVEWKKANGMHSWAVEVIPQGHQHNNSRRVINCL